MFDTLNQTFGLLDQLLDDPQFIKDNRTSEKAFSRKRILDFKTVFYCICSSQKRSLHTELSSFLMKASRDIPVFSPQAFSKARYKIHPGAFYAAFRQSAKRFCIEKDLITLHGYRVFAVDGTSLLLPDTPQNRDTFGSCGNAQKTYASASASIFYDVLNDIVIDAVIGRRFSSERKDCYDMIEKTEDASFTSSKKLILLDRGYPSREMYLFLKNHGYQYLVRLQSAVPKAVLDMEGDDNIIIDSRNHSIVKRILKIHLPSGETEYLATNLFDPRYTVEDFYHLYHLRWSIETKYLDIKHKTELEKFTGYRPDGIRQDFYVCLLLLNLSAMLKREAEKRRTKKKASKWVYQISITAVINLMRENMVVLLYGAVPRIPILEKMSEVLKNKRSAIRPGRHSERKRPRTVKRYILNHK